MLNPPRRLSRLQSKSPHIRNNLAGIVLVEPNKAKLVKGEVLPPWQQPVQIILGTERSNGLQVTDFWTLKMRKSVIKTFFPSKSLSKVGPVFHSYERQLDSDRIKKLWQNYTQTESQSTVNRSPRDLHLPPLSVSPSALQLRKPRKFRNSGR